MSLVLRTDALGAPQYFGGTVERDFGLGVVLAPEIASATPVQPNQIAAIRRAFPSFAFKREYQSNDT